MLLLGILLAMVSMGMDIARLFACRLKNFLTRLVRINNSSNMLLETLLVHLVSFGIVEHILALPFLMECILVIQCTVKNLVLSVLFRLASYLMVRIKAIS